MTNSLGRDPEGAAGRPAGKRQRLIDAASQLLHQQGVETTTLAGIAQAADGSHRSPKSRLKALVSQYADQSEVVALYGCPHGSLCSELDKRPSRPGFALAELMGVPIAWAEEQFRALGRRDAHDLAVSLVAAYEGSALLANTFRDPDILAREARRLNRWIDAL